MKVKNKFILIAVILLVIIFLVFCSIIIWAENESDKFCFYTHLDEAIEVNELRAEYYSELTEGESKKISDSLIEKEKASKFIALLMDLKSRKLLNDKGDPLICDAFVSMAKIENKENKVRNTSIVSDQIISEFVVEMNNFRNMIEKYKNDNNFIDIEKSSRSFLHEIELIEEDTLSNFCMTKHVVESLGIASKQASIADTTDDKKKKEFYNKFINVQIGALSDFPIYLDYEAQKMHQVGVGIICNDVPKILF